MTEKHFIRFVSNAIYANPKLRNFVLGDVWAHIPSWCEMQKAGWIYMDNAIDDKPWAYVGVYEEPGECSCIMCRTLND